MKDSNRMIHYLGFKSTPGGGRCLEFSVDESHEATALFAITISGSFFTGPGKISFQESAGICRTMLLKGLDAGTFGKLQGDVAELRTLRVTIFRFENTEIRHQGELEWLKAHVPPRTNALGKRLELTARRKKNAVARKFEKRKHQHPHGRETRIPISPGSWRGPSLVRNGSTTMKRSRSLTMIRNSRVAS
jgi:hypothetical protein